MSHPSWLPPKSTHEPVGHVTARMETTHAFGMPSISVSTQQTPKKFAPVVAPKPKYNPYKQPGSDDFPPPPPPLPGDDLGNLPAPPGAFPPPPSMEEAVFNVQGSGFPTGSPVTSPPGSTPVTGHKRMIIPNQPPLTATKKSTAKAPAQPAAPPTPVGTLKPQPQPVPASYTTASTPTRPAFNVQVKTAQPSPHFQPPGPQPMQYGSLGPNQSYAPPPARPPGPAQYAPSQPRGPDYGYAPQPVRPSEPGYGYAPSPGRYQDPYYPGGPGYGGRNGSEPSYVPQLTWKPEPAYTTVNTLAQNPAGPYQPSSTKTTYITDPVLAPPPPPMQPKSGYPGPASNVPLFRPEDELEQLTKKMLYDMENPPSDDYFGRCARCGENVIGEGTGCTAMDQVFHVECFICMTCGNKLKGQPFYAVEKKAFCEPCYINTLEQCSVCAKPIMERILRATGKAYHPHCFTCVMCHRSLDGIPFTVDAGGNIHCIEDFHKEFAPRCSVCKEPIMPAPGQEETIRIVALDRDFHVQCYRCEDCGGLLSEGDNQGCYPLDGHILCKTCNSARIQALTAKASTDL
ncbi:lipoma-preferred partner isoform X2 [Emydura macquarii macquarii]|uniref:lipoma-preferred partner isoform X2 n=1 Tax=Emydura macquarii macquarii TaxID=1129001 RepID=UPI00352B8D5D